MGLDTVELVMAIEETFGIEIPDEDAEKILTVGDLHEYVLKRIEDRPARHCASLHAFGRLRAALIDEFRVDREDVKLTSATEELVPKDDRRECWIRLQERLDLKIPSLHLPWPLTVALLLSLVVLGVMLLINGHGGATIVFVAVATVALFILSRPFATEFPSDCLHISGLVQSILRYNFATLSHDPEGSPGALNSQEVWNVVCAVIVEQLGVKPEAVVYEAEFVKDLGAS